MTAPILAATNWASNAELIIDAHRLGYIGDRVLDPTYGRGNWWKLWQPVELVTHDIRIDGVDFRDLPDDGLFDTIAFDPPYVPQGGRATSTTQEFLDRYGLVEVPSTHGELLDLIVEGMVEFKRHLKPGGTVLVKCMSFVYGGKWRPLPRLIANHAEKMKYRQIDELVHLRSPGPQPARDRQLTARRNYSLMMVFRR